MRQSLVWLHTIGTKEHQQKLPQTYWSPLQTKIITAAVQMLWRTSLWIDSGKDTMATYHKITPMFTNNIISCCKTGSVLWHVWDRITTAGFGARRYEPRLANAISAEEINQGGRYRGIAHHGADQGASGELARRYVRMLFTQYAEIVVLTGCKG
jgi:hypothetical protein